MQTQSISLADTLLRSIGGKEDQYTADIKKNTALLKQVAVRVADLPSILAESLNDELLAVLEEQKTVVRSLAKDNVEREQYVRTFCQAVETIRERLGGEAVFAASENSLLPVDYQKAIDDMMAFHASSQPAIDLYDNELYSEIVDAMGDPKPTITDSQKKKKKQQKRRRGSRPEEEEDDDDDIEVMRNVETQASGSATATASLRCPISRAFMTDAVQNTECHHIYSRAGITGYIQQSQAAGYRGRPVKCPVFGCMNRNVTLTQLVDHYETSRQAQKEVRLQSQHKAMQDQANALMDTDDDE
jgi:Zinc-finger of the MIZ type in Nse subunit